MKSHLYLAFDEPRLMKMANEWSRASYDLGEEVAGIYLPVTGILSTVPQDDAIYVLCHGDDSTKSNTITNGASDERLMEELSPDALALQLKENGLRRGHKRLKLWACTGGRGGKKSFAFALFQALVKLGYGTIAVYGYEDFLTNPFYLAKNQKGEVRWIADPTKKLSDETVYPKAVFFGLDESPASLYFNSCLSFDQIFQRARKADEGLVTFVNEKSENETVEGPDAVPVGKNLSGRTYRPMPPLPAYPRSAFKPAVPVKPIPAPPPPKKSLPLVPPPTTKPAIPTKPLSPPTQQE